MNNLNKKIITIAVCISIIIIYLIYSLISKNNSDYFEIENSEQNIITKNESYENIIIVHIAGAVKSEGIVELNANSRLADAITFCGGLTEDADVSKINLAYKLQDGQKIYIPFINDVNIINNAEESIFINEETNFQGSPEELININTASQTQFETLPGIGPSTALKIINYRKENGYFNNIEDLKNISGIGEAKFNTIKDLICV